MFVAGVEKVIGSTIYRSPAMRPFPCDILLGMRSRLISEEIFLSLLLFLFLMSFYMLFYSTAPASRFIGEGHVKIEILNNLLDEGTIGLDGPSQAVPGRDGKYYTWHDFGQNIFVLPVFVFTRGILDALAFFIANSVFTSLSALVLFRLLMLASYRPWPSLATAMVFALATFAFFYAAKAPFEHPIANFFALGSFYFMARLYYGGSRKNILYAALLLGFGIITRADIILTTLPLLVLYAGSRGRSGREWKDLSLVVFVLLPFLVFILFYNYVRFENIFVTGYAMANKKETLFSLGNIPMGLAGFLVSPGRSIFVFSPVLVAALFYLKDFKRHVNKRFFQACVGMVSIYILFFSAFFAWDGEWCWGPRYILIVVPFMLMPLASFFESWDRRKALEKAAVIISVIVSALVQFLPAASNFVGGLASKYVVYNGDYQRKDIGSQGSFEYFLSFFDPGDSSVLLQTEVFLDTMNVFIGRLTPENLQVSMKATRPQLMFMFDDIIRPDMWWLQNPGLFNYAVATVLLAVAAYSLVHMVVVLRRKPLP